MFDDSYRNSFLRSEELGMLNVVVHTKSFEDEILNRDPVIDRLLRLGTLRGVRLLCTPTENSAVEWKLKEGRVEVATVREDGDWLAVSGGFISPFREHLKRMGEWREPAEPGSKVSILDELFTRPYEVDLFVVAPGDSFLRRDLLRRHYVAPSDAFELVRLLRVGTGRFEIRSNYTVEETHYLEYRRNKFIPVFDRVEVIMRNVKDTGIADDLAAQIASLSKRWELILRAADQISIHALQKPTTESPGRCSYHLAYFVMLVTGLFDELAWTALYHMGVKVNKRYKIDLRCIPESKKFHADLMQSNPDLGKFVSDRLTQATLSLFYPARNQMQHRTVLSARLHSTPPPPHVVWDLPDETLRIITSVSGDAGGSWGILEGRKAGYVEPHLFSLAATQAVASVANGMLERIDWNHYLHQLPADLQERILHRLDNRLGFPPRPQWMEEEPLYF